MKNMLFADEEVRFTVKAKELKGILTHPAAQAPYPAIILLHGSDRSNMNNPYFVEHAENLISGGFAVLRYDGPGWAGGSSENSGFETLQYRTEEAIAAIRYLQSRPDIKANAVGLWGISQGGWVCQMTAAAYDGVAFIIPVSGPGVSPAEQEVYRVEAESKAAGFDTDEVAKATLMRRLTVDAVLPQPTYREVNLSESQRLGDGPWSELTKLTYSPNRLDPAAEFPKIIEIFETIKDERWAKFLHPDQVLSLFKSIPPQAWESVKAQMRAVMDVNPADYLIKIHCPVLAIFGENDTSIPVNKSITIYEQCLREAGNEDFTSKVFPNASHAIRNGEAFAAGYFEVMLNWLRNLSI